MIQGSMLASECVCVDYGSHPGVPISPNMSGIISVLFCFQDATATCHQDKRASQRKDLFIRGKVIIVYTQQLLYVHTAVIVTQSPEFVFLV